MNKAPRTFYHYTSVRCLPSILAHGIRPSADGRVYLTDRAWGEGLQILNQSKRAARLTVRVDGAVRHALETFHAEWWKEGCIAPEQIISADIFCKLNLDSTPLPEVKAIAEYMSRQPHKSMWECAVDNECGESVHEAVAADCGYKLTKAGRVIHKAIARYHLRSARLT